MKFLKFNLNSAYYKGVTRTPQTSNMESFALLRFLALNYCCKALHLDICCGSSYATALTQSFFSNFDNLFSYLATFRAEEYSGHGNLVKKLSQKITARGGRGFRLLLASWRCVLESGTVIYIILDIFKSKIMA